MMTTVQASIRKDLDRRMEELSTDAFYNEHNQALLWSRRIDEKNRLVYRISEDTIEIVQCRTHYGDK